MMEYLHELLQLVQLLLADVDGLVWYDPGDGLLAPGLGEATLVGHDVGSRGQQGGNGNVC